MPIIQIDYAKPGPETPERAADLATRLAETARSLAAMHLGKKAELTAVTVRRIAPDHWFIGDAPLSAGGGATMTLKILITGATNTKAEKATFIAAVWHDFEAILGRLRPESYIVVEDHPADSWGYGGLTQERRFIAAAIERERQQDGVADAYRRYGVR